jgi:prophage tail gpP-like protein
MLTTFTLTLAEATELLAAAKRGGVPIAVERVDEPHGARDYLPTIVVESKHTDRSKAHRTALWKLEKAVLRARRAKCSRSGGEA